MCLGIIFTWPFSLPLRTFRIILIFPLPRGLNFFLLIPGCGARSRDLSLKFTAFFFSLLTLIHAIAETGIPLPSSSCLLGLESLPRHSRQGSRIQGLRNGQSRYLGDCTERTWMVILLRKPKKKKSSGIAFG